MNKEKLRGMGTNHVSGGDAEMRRECGGEAEAAAVGFGPGVDCLVVDDGGAVAMDDGRAFDEAERREGAVIC